LGVLTLKIEKLREHEESKTKDLTGKVCILWSFLILGCFLNTVYTGQIKEDEVEGTCRVYSEDE
jgi:hypothetical protein